MKNLITIMIMLVAVGCGKTEPKPLSPEDSVVGLYKGGMVVKDNEDYHCHIMLRNDGVCETFWETLDGEELEDWNIISNWKVKDGEVITTEQETKFDAKSGDYGKITDVYRIETDDGPYGVSLLGIASGLTRGKDGKFERRDKSTKDFGYFKKIKGAEEAATKKLKE